MEEEMGNSQDQGVKGSSQKSSGSLKKQNSTNSQKSLPKSPKPTSQKSKTSKNSKHSSQKSQNSQNQKSTPGQLGSQPQSSQKDPLQGYLAGTANQEKLNTNAESENRHDMQEKIQAQLEQIRVEEEARSELISKKQNLAILLQEYQESPQFLMKVQGLTTQYNGYRMLRRDGSCFYRAFLFRLFEHLIQNKSDLVLWAKIEKKFNDGLEFMVKNGFAKIVAEDFCESAVNFLGGLRTYDVNDEDLRQRMLNLERSNELVMFLRFITSAYIQQEGALFQFYVPDGLPVEYFCQTAVEPLDQDADQVQIMAVHNYFELPLYIVYLDNTPGEMTYDLKFPDQEPTENIWLKLLYRPGHYDLIYA